MRLLLLLAAMLLPVPAVASDWVTFAKNENQYKVWSIDNESIQQISGGHLRVWIKEASSYPGNLSKYLTLYEFSCTGQFQTLDSKKSVAREQ